MTALTEQLLDTFRHLSKDEQFAFAQEIEAELVSSSGSEIPHEVLAEVRQRLEEYYKHPERGLSDSNEAVFHDQLNSLD